MGRKPIQKTCPQLYELPNVPVRTYPTKEQPDKKKCAKHLQRKFIKEEIKIENSK